MPILISNIQDKLTLSENQENLLEAVLECGLKHHQRSEAEVSLALIDNDQIQELNSTYRQIDNPTDVLSFAFDEADTDFVLPDQEEMPDLLGDIYISVERAAEQSVEYGHSLERELCYLAVHGLLHLLGYDHMDEEEKAIMRAAEEEIMQEFSLGRDDF